MSFAKSPVKNPVYRAILYRDNHEILEVHTLVLEPEGKNRYRALISMQCFYDRELEARYGDKPKKNLPPFFVGQFEHKYFHDKMEAARRADSVKHNEEYKDMWAAYPHFHHETLWDFYKAIGYDYKAKKWTRPLPN